MTPKKQCENSKLTWRRKEDLRILLLQTPPMKSTSMIFSNRVELTLMRLIHNTQVKMRRMNSKKERCLKRKSNKKLLDKNIWRVIYSSLLSQSNKKKLYSLLLLVLSPKHWKWWVKTFENKRDGVLLRMELFTFFKIKIVIKLITTLWLKTFKSSRCINRRKMWCFSFIRKSFTELKYHQVKEMIKLCCGLNLFSWFDQNQQIILI